MSNQLPRAFNSALVLALFLFTCFAGALAQTPSPTPVNPATLPPGQEQQPPATAPPGVNIIPGAQPTPITPAPTPITPMIQEPRQPNFPDVQVQPLPPLPD